MQHTSAPAMPHQQSTNSQQTLYSSQQLPPNAGLLVPETTPPVPTVTPLMWQDAFTTAYVSGHGNKRYRADEVDPATFNQYAKRRA